MKKDYLIVLSFIFLLFINTAKVNAAPQTDSNVYNVKPGDTLLSLSEKYHTSVEALKLTNGLQSNSLTPGQRLWVPTTYQVAAGDSLERISKNLNSTVPLIKKKNGLTTDVIRIGQSLKIPQRRLEMQGQYVLMTRAEFRDWLFHQKFTRKINKIQHHHTWHPSYRNMNGHNYFTLLKGMEEFHVHKMGWKNIAQHLTTFPDGKIAVSRPFNINPEGSIGPKANAGAIMIEHVGNFDVGKDQMTPEHRETIVYTTALLSLRFGLTPDINTITYHHWWDLVTKERVFDNNKGHAVKTCPGTGFFGGNSTTEARTHFYPLVIKKMKEIREIMD